MIKGYIFDLDGTLLDTLASIANSFNRSLRSLGYPDHPVDSFRYFIGDGQRKCVERCLPEGASEEEIIALMAHQTRDYALTWQQNVTVYDGIEPLLETLQDRGKQLAVLSNKNHEFAVQCVSHFFPKVSFDVVMGYAPDVPHKPDPTGALKIAAAMGLAPNEIAFIGDSAPDMKTAVASGNLAIGALWGFRDFAELKSAGAQHIIDHPSRVLTVGNGECP